MSSESIDRILKELKEKDYSTGQPDPLERLFPSLRKGLRENHSFWHAFWYHPLLYIIPLVIALSLFFYRLGKNLAIPYDLLFRIINF